MAINNPAAATQTWSEPDTPSFNQGELAKMSHDIQGEPSLLDGIAVPIDLEAVKKKIFDSLLPGLASLANDLGYGWVGGVGTAGVGEGYIYVPSGVKADAGNGYSFTGPGYRPDLNGPPDGYKSDIRTTIEFVNPHLTFGDTQYSEPRWLDQTPSNLTSFHVDNASSTNPVSTNFSIEYSSQGQSGVSASKSWQNSWHFSASSTQTFSSGGEGAFFPTVSISLTEEGGMAGQTGGSQSTSNSVTTGVRSTYSFSHQTPGGYVGDYAVTCVQGKAAVNFTAMATLEFGVTFHGFLRWGGGKKFQGGTNYHNQYSGSGDRPVVPFTLGSKDMPFWQALKEAVDENADPWNWTAMFQQIPSQKQNSEMLTSNAKIMCSFPISGVIASISRYNVGWATLSEKPTLAGGQSAPTEKPTASDNEQLTDEQPTPAPTETPTASDNEQLTDEQPTPAPTETPTASDNEQPTPAATETPTASDTTQPSVADDQANTADDQATSGQ